MTEPKLLVQYEREKYCPVCEAGMNPDVAWWWTDKGPACSSPCAKVLMDGEA